jgi:hyperosmotically inducible periplasmic protein
MRVSTITGVLVTAFLVGVGYGRASDNPTDAHGTDKAAPATQPNNTGINKRDRSGATLTPEDQGGTDADREMTRKIRRAINSTKGLSTDAKNIKIITLNGKVTLRGPVQNEQEQKTIKDIVQGITSVNNQLEVKTMNQ